MTKEKNLRIRNSTAEFLIFSKQAGENSIEVRIEDETVWLTQKLIGVLFEVDVRTINEHLGNIYQNGELHKEATIRKFRIVQTEGKVTQEIAKAFAESEFEKYRVVQDRLFESDFDKQIKRLLEGIVWQPEENQK
jgi:hypothetical protein